MNRWIAFVLDVVWLAVIPFALAAYGGHVAADAIADNRKRRAVKLRFWGMALFGLLIAIGYQWRIMKTDEVRQVQTQDFQNKVNARLDQIISQPVSTEQQQQAKQLKQSVKSANPANPSLPAPIIQTPYGNLAHRCEELGNAIISLVQYRTSMRPDPVTHREDYNNWYRENDGFGFRMHFYDDVVRMQQELHSVHVDDPRLDDLIEKHEDGFRRRQQEVQRAINFPEAFHLSIEDIQEIGIRFKSLAGQIPR